MPIASACGALQRDPSVLTLLDRWLARTPFVDWGGTPFRETYRAAVVQHAQRPMPPG